MQNEKIIKPDKKEIVKANVNRNDKLKLIEESISRNDTNFIRALKKLMN